jgi:hypothetical protein
LENILRTTLIVVTLLLCMVVGGLAQEAVVATQVTSNLQLMQVLAERIGGRIAEELARHDSARILVQVFPKESAWYVESGIVRGLTAHGWQPVASGVAKYNAELGLSNLRVRYENVRRDWIFGTKTLDRNVTVAMNVKVADQHSGEILLSTTMEEETNDSIEMSAVPLVENPHLPVTVGSMPSEGFFSTVAEPLVALGAVAVAVFLLFHVRS